MKTPVHWYRHTNGAYELISGYLGTDIKDKHGVKICEGDTLSIDFDGAAKFIGDDYCWFVNLSGANRIPPPALRSNSETLNSVWSGAHIMAASIQARTFQAFCL